MPCVQNYFLLFGLNLLPDNRLPPSLMPRTTLTNSPDLAVREMSSPPTPGFARGSFLGSNGLAFLFFFFFFPVVSHVSVACLHRKVSAFLTRPLAALQLQLCQCCRRPLETGWEGKGEGGDRPNMGFVLFYYSPV